MFWYDGQLIQGDSLELNIFDPGLLYGATVFTTLRVYGSLEHRLTHWQAHCDRLTFSLQTFGWQLPDWEKVRQGAEALLPHYQILRVAVFADGREWMIGRFLPKDLEERQQGVTAWLAEDSFKRSLTTHKTGNYLGAWLAQQQAQKIGAQEVILTDAQGNWLETSTGNLWGWQDNCWWTPPLEAGILPGVVRARLLQWFSQRSIPVKETSWSRELVKSMEAIAYTNSVVEVIPFHTVIAQDNSIDPSHPALDQLRAYFRAEVEESNERNMNK